MQERKIYSIHMSRVSGNIGFYYNRYFDVEEKLSQPSGTVHQPEITIQKYKWETQQHNAAQDVRMC